jgi:urease accessory protein
MVYRIHQAFTRSDRAALEAWNEYLAASRESAELALEDTQMGAALVRVLRSTGELGDGDVLPEAISYVTAFAIACARSGVGAREAVLGFLWANAESQTSAAVRLVPLGQTAGQRMVAALQKELPELTTLALARPDHELGASLPALALGSALHEIQYTRLFRS